MKYEFDLVALEAFGKKLGTVVTGGQVIELIGDVGAGKTTLTKAIALGLGISANIQSPTYTISNEYDARDGLRLVHYDFYRLNDAGIMADELVEEEDDQSAVVVIEWGDIIRDVLPADRLTIRIDATGETTRTLKVEATGERSIALREKIA